jgi:hypothetical protein
MPVLATNCRFGRALHSGLCSWSPRDSTPYERINHRRADRAPSQWAGRTETSANHGTGHRIRALLERIAGTERSKCRARGRGPPRKAPAGQAKQPSADRGRAHWSQSCATAGKTRDRGHNRVCLVESRTLALLRSSVLGRAL